MTRFARVRITVAALAVVGYAAASQALPQRSLVARPLPPAVWTTAEADGGPTLSLDAARALTDSLLAAVTATRGLKSLRPIPVQTQPRAAMRARLEEITRQDGIEPALRQEETLLRFLGLVPAGSDLVRLYHDLLEEQLAGFYDIDRRALVLADWVPRSSQAVVLSHELVHALQDQHFSLRVRKRLGFDSSDAEAAWHALIEGDATAVMCELDLAPAGRHFTALADSNAAVTLTSPVARAAAGGVESEKFKATPRAVRESLSFPYREGLRYITALFDKGGWAAVDAAFVHPPASTEQVMHPDRMNNETDAPVRLTLPDVSGILGAGYRATATGILGEHDLGVYLSQYVDPELAAVSAAGWGGCTYALYEGPAGSRPLFVLVSTWDSEDDAVEFFGGVIGALEVRYPDQTGAAESSSQDQILWNLDKDQKYMNLLRVRERQVLCIEGLPSAQMARVVGKIDIGLQTDDPTPEVRAREKSNLPWNRLSRPISAGARSPVIDLPEGWTAAPRTDSSVVFEAVRGKARLSLHVDRRVSREIGLDGYAHQIASDLQKRGKGIYVQTDVNYNRDIAAMYQHVFTQYQGVDQFTYLIGVVDLAEGFGALVVEGPTSGDVAVEPAFYSLMDSMRLVPAVAVTETASPATKP